MYRKRDKKFCSFPKLGGKTHGAAVLFNNFFRDIKADPRAVWLGQKRVLRAVEFPENPVAVFCRDADAGVFDSDLHGSVPRLERYRNRPFWRIAYRVINHVFDRHAEFFLCAVENDRGFGRIVDEYCFLFAREFFFILHDL